MSVNTTKEATMSEGTATTGGPVIQQLQYDQQSTYAAEVLSQELDGREDSLQVRLDVKLLGKHRQAWRPDKGLIEFGEADQEVKSIYLTIDPAKTQSFEFTRKDLERLGFGKGMNFERLFPDYKGKDKFSLVGKTVGVRVRIVERDGRVRQYWNLANSERAQGPSVTSEQAKRFLAEKAEEYAAIETADQDAPF